MPRVANLPGLGHSHKMSVSIDALQHDGDYESVKQARFRIVKSADSQMHCTYICTDERTAYYHGKYLYTYWERRAGMGWGV